MSYPRGFFCVVLVSNRRNCFTCCFLSVIFEHFLLWEPILKSGTVLSQCDFNDIDVIVDIGTIGAKSFENFANNANICE